MLKKLSIVGICSVISLALLACSSLEATNRQPLLNAITVNALSNSGSDDYPHDTAQETEKNKIEYEYTEEGIIKPEQAETIIKEISDKVIRLISEKDMESLSLYIHPEKGIRFTPYTYVLPHQDKVFDQEKIKDFFKDENIYLWGHYDGSGEEIKLTPGQYFEKFVYSKDFIDAEQIGYNTVLSFGNAIENQFEVYSNPIVVEYYFSGFDPEYAGMDWRSLRLVFEEYNGEWYLVGIIHNQWTI